MSKTSTRVVRAGLIFGLLAGVSIVSTTSASASSTPYTCTATYPEVCLGATYSLDSFGDPGGVESQQVQTLVNQGVYYEYVLVTPDGVQHHSGTYHAGSPGWGAKWPQSFHQYGWYEAFVKYGSTASLGNQSATASVYAP